MHLYAMYSLRLCPIPAGCDSSNIEARSQCVFVNHTTIQYGTYLHIILQALATEHRKSVVEETNSNHQTYEYLKYIDMKISNLHLTVRAEYIMASVAMVLCVFSLLLELDHSVV